MKVKIRTIIFYVLNFFIITTTLLSCSQTKKENNNREDKKESVELIENENFLAFLESFSKKSTFQRQRVLFPLQATVLDPLEFEMKTVKEEINYEDWFLLDFSYDSTFTTRQIDRYEQNIRIYKDSAIVEQRGIDNGIFANYLFAKKDGRWFLKSFTDVSY